MFPVCTWKECVFRAWGCTVLKRSIKVCFLVSFGTPLLRWFSVGDLSVGVNGRVSFLLLLYSCPSLPLHVGTIVVQSLSRVWLCNLMNCSSLGFPVLHYLLEFAQTHVHWAGDSIQPSCLCRPLLLPPSVIPSIRAFSSESALCTRWPKYCSLSFSIGHSNEYSGLISFKRIDWLDLLAVQGTLKSLLQYHSSKSINSSTHRFLYSPTLISIHDYWKNYSFD